MKMLCLACVGYSAWLKCRRCCCCTLKGIIDVPGSFVGGLCKLYLVLLCFTCLGNYACIPGIVVAGLWGKVAVSEIVVSTGGKSGCIPGVVVAGQCGVKWLYLELLWLLLGEWLYTWSVVAGLCGVKCLYLEFLCLLVVERLLVVYLELLWLACVG
jgi:hypothetical protein